MNTTVASQNMSTGRMSAKPLAFSVHSGSAKSLLTPATPPHLMHRHANPSSFSFFKKVQSQTLKMSDSNAKESRPSTIIAGTRYKDRDLHNEALKLASEAGFKSD